jgi:hypothetical protein
VAVVLPIFFPVLYSTTFILFYVFNMVGKQEGLFWYFVDHCRVGNRSDVSCFLAPSLSTQPLHFFFFFLAFPHFGLFPCFFFLPPRVVVPWYRNSLIRRSRCKLYGGGGEYREGGKGGKGRMWTKLKRDGMSSPFFF